MVVGGSGGSGGWGALPSALALPSPFLSLSLSLSGLCQVIDLSSARKLSWKAPCSLAARSPTHPHTVRASWRRERERERERRKLMLHGVYLGPLGLARFCHFAQRRRECHATARQLPSIHPSFAVVSYRLLRNEPPPSEHRDVFRCFERVSE